jgi:glutamate racemase
LASSQPIGIFDSGIGGMTVANAIRKALPNERFIYFGDTAHLPYGDKSPERIRHYAARITQYLIDKKCKAIVIACNTASAHAYKTVCDIAGPDIPVINVIDPVAHYVSEKFDKKRIGVIGTKGTIASRVYVHRIEKLNKSLKVISNATPLLASMIEEGYYNNKISQTIINSYLSKPNFKDIDALILACTHYPLIRKEVDLYYKKKIEIIDNGEVAALALKEELFARKLEANKPSKQKDLFVISDYTEAFEISTKIFFGEKVALKTARIWG